MDANPLVFIPTGGSYVFDWLEIFLEEQLVPAPPPGAPNAPAVPVVGRQLARTIRFARGAIEGINYFVRVALTNPAAVGNEWSCELSVLPLVEARMHNSTSVDLYFNANNLQHQIEHDPNAFDYYLSGATVLVKLNDGHQQQKSSPGEFSARFTDESLATQFNTDCELTFDDSDTPLFVHRNFLSAQSSTFKALFEGDWKEKGAKSVPLKDLAKANFLTFITCLYNPQELSRENLGMVMELADRFDCKQLMEQCKELICGTVPLKASHFETLILLADRFELAQAVRATVRKMGARVAFSLLKKPFLDSLSSVSQELIFERIRDLGPSRKVISAPALSEVTSDE